MIEVYGNLWEYPADWRCITTNGYVRQDGAAVMGRGCAAEAKAKLPGVEYTLGALLSVTGNEVHWLGTHPELGQVWSFPVKHHWRESADLDLIEESARQLVAHWWTYQGHDIVVLPRPGCSNGSLSWEEVKPRIEPILPDWCHVITWRPDE